MDAVEEIKSRLAIEDIIGEYVELKRAGRNFKGLSPFTSEKTPSFMVSPEKQIWHDFSSGKGGNIFSFVMEMEGLDFKGALEQLARKSGVDLDQYRSSNYKQNSKFKERLYTCLEAAAKYYQHSLKNNNKALEYVIKKRSLQKDTLLTFRIGYSPNSGDALCRYLAGKGYSDEEIKKAGLGNVYRGNMGDMFRGRLMIPLMDSFGKVIGFTARQLENQENSPKYINTPSTLLYDKSRHVFGLHLAKELIRKKEFCVVVEGNMDVIASNQASVKNVVATAGTAMTVQHLKEISRFASDIRLSFDQDRAGLTAAERTVILANQLDLELKVITIPSGKDPDDLIQKDPKQWQKIIDQPEYAMDWLVDYYVKQTDLVSGSGKKSFAGKIMPIINKITDAVEREHYKQHVANLLGVSSSILKSQIESAGTNVVYKKAKKVQKVSKSQADIEKTEKQFMSIALMQPSLRLYIEKITPEMLNSEPAKQLLPILQDNKDRAEDVLEGIKDVQIVVDYGKVVSLLYEELYAHLEFIELEYEAARLQVRVIEHYVKAQKTAIAMQLQTQNDQNEVTKLLQKAKKYDELLKSAREAQVGE